MFLISCPMVSFSSLIFFFFFFNDTATTEIYTLSLHDALPILVRARIQSQAPAPGASVRVEVPTGPSTTVVAIPVSALRKGDRKSTRLNSSHVRISYAVFCLKKKKNQSERTHDGSTQPFTARSD